MIDHIVAGPASTKWYRENDYHDANRLNNANALPVLLDFDNFPGREDRPDDTRRLSSWPNTTRARLVRSLWHTVRLYNPLASISVRLDRSIVLRTVNTS